MLLFPVLVKKHQKIPAYRQLGLTLKFFHILQEMLRLCKETVTASLNKRHLLVFFFLLTEIKIISLQEFITITAHTFPQATDNIAQRSPLEYLKSIYQYSSFQNSSKKLKTNKQKSYTAHQFTLLDADKLERIEKGEEQKAIPREVNNGYFSAIYCMKILVES